VWLDRGELDKLIAQDTAETSLRGAASASRHDRQEHDRAYGGDRRYEDHRSGYRTQKKKRSIFDVFDFD
jgi:Zn-finger nucleic acid-binding protein